VSPADGAPPQAGIPEKSGPLPGVPEGPVPASQGGERLLDLVRVMARLRGPGGCPWDAEQDHRSLARHLLEEAHEVLDAIDGNDDDRLRDELGDLLLQVVFHAQMAADEGRWDVDDVAEGIVAKLIRRHPHVFGDVSVSGADEVLVNWERIKAEEKGTAERPAEVEDDIPATLPALARASKVLRRAAGWGFEWRTTEGALSALREEIGELERAADPDNAEEEVGDVLFATVGVARRLGVDPETALRRTVRGFAGRYDRFMAMADEQGLDLASMSEDELRRMFREARDASPREGNSSPRDADAVASATEPAQTDR
jgi:tetrapyrrole methylase family protein/MazG family protein